MYCEKEQSKKLKLERLNSSWDIQPKTSFRCTISRGTCAESFIQRSSFSNDIEGHENSAGFATTANQEGGCKSHSRSLPPPFTTTTSLPFTTTTLRRTHHLLLTFPSTANPLYHRNFLQCLTLAISHSTRLSVPAATPSNSKSMATSLSLPHPSQFLKA